MMAQRFVSEGRTDVAEQLIQLQQMIAELSTFGQQLIERSRRAGGNRRRSRRRNSEQFGEDATREDFLNMALRYAEDDRTLAGAGRAGAPGLRLHLLSGTERQDRAGACRCSAMVWKRCATSCWN